MKKDWNIQPTFNIPKDYRRTFILECNGVRHWMRVSRRKGYEFGMDEGKISSRKTLNLSLDWIQEIDAIVRAECAELVRCDRKRKWKR